MLNPVIVRGFDDAAVAAAWAEVRAGIIGGVATRGLYFPPGHYKLTKPLIAYGGVNGRQVYGLHIAGAGRRVTRITYSNTEGKPFIGAYNMLRFFTLADMTVISGAAYGEPSSLRFCLAVTDMKTGFNQRWNWRGVEFSGRWRYVLGLDGPSTTNLNSEMLFEQCETDTTFVADQAMMVVGGAEDGVFDHQECQFLNYTFRDCNFTGVAGTWLLFNSGGSITVTGGSWSGVKPSSGPFAGGAPITWLSMPRRALNNRSGTQLAVSRVRFEPKRDDHVVIDCRWGTGTVAFTDCSVLGGAQHAQSYGWTPWRFTGQEGWGKQQFPAVSLERVATVGNIRVDVPSLPHGSGSLRCAQSYFYRGNSGERVNGYPLIINGQQQADYAPGRVAFTDCDNVDDA